ncbi:SRPBCC family protein [Streptomyces sp. NPDC001985]|uniref:SRPBCC family protein n=1 Tax=Streptomyces sp. NPDC001985 TaxID=3154406 RepID=UPI00331AD6F2
MADQNGPLSADNPAVRRLKEEAQGYLAAQAQQTLMSAGRMLGRTTGRLNDIAEGRGPGLAKLALEGGRKAAEGKGPLRGALEVGASHLKENVTRALKNAGGGKSKGGGGSKPVVIIESVDVGVPVREAYDQWTRYQDFAAFARGVKSASHADDTTSDWQMKVFWSSRSWKARTTEQIPDSRIQWTSEGGKGTTKGVVTFHELGESLTRVLLVIEYYPKGLFEKTGNIWRAQGRRVRLDLKNFARHITLRGEAEDGWRGEIRDGEVVLSHDDAMAEEEEAAEESSHDEPAGEETDEEYEEEGDHEPEGEHDDAEGEEYDDEEVYEDEHEEAPAEEGEFADEDLDEEAAEREYAASGSRDRR